MILCLNCNISEDDENFPTDAIEKVFFYLFFIFIFQIIKYLKPIKGPILSVYKKMLPDIPDFFI